MGKGFKGKTCVYCAAEGASATADHIFARQFFPKKRRGGLPMVPACQVCNSAKSVLEHYLTAVLPFAGRHQDASDILTSDVPGRLNRNQRLYRELSAGFTPIVVLEGGQPVETYAIPIQSEKYVELFRYVARGLTAFHWGTVIPSNYAVDAFLLNPFYEPHFQSLFRLDARRRINGRVGGDTFLYQGAQAHDDPALTIWRFRAFGGIVTAGDDHHPEPAEHTVWVTSGQMPWPSSKPASAPA